MKLTPSKARELSSKGMSVDMARVVRSVVKEVVKETAKEPERLMLDAIQSVSPIERSPGIVEVKTDDKIIKELQALAKSNEIASSALLASMKELSKPKPPKKWHCTVGRDVRGIIKTVDIVEI